MKEILPTPPSLVRNDTQEVQRLYSKNVIPSYGRFDLALSHGAGARLWDMGGKQYLDLAGGIAVCSLGHANSEITQALVEQSKRLVHVSNLYYTEPQARLAERGVPVGIGSLWRFFDRRGISFKKNRARRRAGTS